MNRDFVNRHTDLFLKGILLFSFFVGIIHIFLVNFKYIDHTEWNFPMIYSVLLITAFFSLSAALYFVINNNNDNYWKYLSISYFMIIIPSDFLYKNTPIYIETIEFSIMLILLSSICFKNRKYIIPSIISLTVFFLFTNISSLPIKRIDLYKNIADKIIISFLLLTGYSIITTLLIRDRKNINLRTRIFLGSIFCISLPLIIFTILKESEIIFFLKNRYLSYENLHLLFLITTVLSVIAIMNSILSYFFSPLLKASNNFERSEKSFFSDLDINTVISDTEISDSKNSYNRIFQLISKKGPDFIWVTGPDMKFKYISPSIFNFLGYTDDEAMNLENVKNIMTEDSYKILEKIQNEIFDLAGLDKMKDKIIQKKFESGLIHKNSSVISSDVILTINFDKSGIPVETIAICRDITKKKNYQNKIYDLHLKLESTQKKLIQNKKLFDIITQNTFDIIFCSDSEMTITYISDSVEAFIGYSPEYIKGKQMNLFATEESNKIIMEIYNELLEYEKKPQYSNAEIVKRIEIQLIKKNNITVWTETLATVIFDENAIITDIIGITRDIDERKKNEVLLTQTKEKLQTALKKLSESERKYKYLVTNSSDVFWTMTPDLKLTYVSPKVYDLQGLTQEEALRLPFEKKFPHESMQIFMGMAHEILSLQGNPESRNQYYNKTYQLPQYHKDGHIIMTEISLTVIFDENAMAKEAIGVTRDISARIAYQKEIERINKELKIANDDLKSLDEMKTNLLSNVSHELRTPLASIKGYISMLSSGASGPLNSKQDKYVNIVHKNIEHLISLIETLLSYSRLDLGEKGLKLGNFNIIELIEEIFDTVNSKNKFRNPLKLNTFSNEIFIFADYRQIKQVFINLIDNAIKFSVKNSPIEIIIKDNTKNIEIEVKDNGIGIPKEKVDIIFERFYQIDSSTTRQFQGMGLGLSIVKRILDLHDSDVSVKSSENIGTSFYFKLKKGSSVKTESEDTSTDKNNLLNIRKQKYEISPILVVDDQIEMLNFLEELFTEANLPVHVINNSKKVADYINENKISLAILDISMADINGLEICHNIKEKYPETPVIMLSAFSEEKYRELAKEAHADDYIVKPFDINQLLEKVRQHITK